MNNTGMFGRYAAAMLLAVMTIMSFAAVSFAEERVVDLDSGAQRSGEFVMTDEAFRSADGMDLRVTMSGLNAGSKAAMLECLSRYYSTGSDDPLKIVDESFVDAEKWDVYDDQRYYYYNDEEDSFSGYDAFQCWAGRSVSTTAGHTTHLPAKPSRRKMIYSTFIQAASTTWGTTQTVR